MTSFLDHLQQARTFATQNLTRASQPANGATAAAVDTATTPVAAEDVTAAVEEAFAAAEPAAAPAASTQTGFDAAAAAAGVPGHDPDAIARAAQEAAAGAAADPTFAQTAAQQVRVQVDPTLVVPAGEQVVHIPVDVPAPPAQVRVVVNQPGAVAVDPATGQVVNAVSATPVDAASSAAPNEGFRRWGVDELFGWTKGVGTPKTATPVVAAPAVADAPAVVAEAAEPAASRADSLLARLGIGGGATHRSGGGVGDLLSTLRGPKAASAAASEVVAKVVDTPVVAEAAEDVVKVAAREGLGDKLVKALGVATKAV